MFRKVFTTPVKPSLKFELRPVTHDNVEAVARLYCDVFLKEPVLYYFGIEKEPLMKYDCRPLATLNAEYNYGVACYDVAKNKLVGTLLSDDPIKLVEKYGNSEYPKLKKACAFNNLFRAENQALFERLSTSPEGWLHGTGFSVDYEYQSMGLGRIMQEYALWEHPILSKIGYFTFDISSPYSRKISRKMNFQEVWSKKWTDMAKIEGYEYYQDMYKAIKKSKMPIDDSYTLALFDRSHFLEAELSRNEAPRFVTSFAGF